MKWTEIFIRFAGGFLLTAALLRFIIAAGDAQVLTLPEPMLGVPLRYAVLLVGVLELAAGILCLFTKRINIQIGLLLWLTTACMVYQIGLPLMHAHPQGTCVGSLTDPLQLMHGTVGLVLQFMPAGLFLGSYAALGGLWVEQKRARESAFLKMACSACGGHIKFALGNLGQKIPCPHCQAAITLRRPTNLKMFCFFCKEHIEFPAHAIGEKIPCPHCRKDITLREPA